jgi:hypothetical protein
LLGSEAAFLWEAASVCRRKKAFGIIGPAWLHPAINFTTSVSAMRRPSFLPIGSFLEAS